jgi:hypothetical protein
VNWRRYSPTPLFANSSNSVIAVLIAAWFVFAAYVYIPDIGRGFVKDDFHWIEAGYRALANPCAALMPTTPDFYRPLIAFTFAANVGLHGLDPHWIAGRPRRWS